MNCTHTADQTAAPCNAPLTYATTFERCRVIYEQHQCAAGHWRECYAMDGAPRQRASGRERSPNTKVNYSVKVSPQFLARVAEQGWTKQGYMDFLQGLVIPPAP